MELNKLDPEIVNVFFYRLEEEFLINEGKFPPNSYFLEENIFENEIFHFHGNNNFIKSNLKMLDILYSIFLKLVKKIETDFLKKILIKLFKYSIFIEIGCVHLFKGKEELKESVNGYFDLSSMSELIISYIKSYIEEYKTMENINETLKKVRLKNNENKEEK